MPSISLSNISKSYISGHRAVADLDLYIPDGAFMCLLGPSGCGKTTTLRMIAGLEHPTDGSIAVGDRVLDSVSDGVYLPPERRGMGLVFQNYALWPHLTVARNVEFGLKMQKVPKAERARRVQEALTMMQIEWASGRYPSELSGGQQQRVSLARMLAIDPAVLLLDEPLSNLDAQLRLEMRAELKRIHNETGHTMVFVTHDQLEAMTMATHIAVMKDGFLQQLAPPMEIYDRPANAFVGQFVGSPPMNIITLDDETPIATELRGYLTSISSEVAAAAGSVGIRPEALHLTSTTPEAPGSWSFKGAVSAVLPTGSSWTVSIDRDGAEMFLESYCVVEARAGEPVGCWITPQHLHLFDRDGNRMTAWDDVHARHGAGVA